MTVEIQPFEFPATGEQIRIVMVDDDPWFIAADVATALGFRMASDATRVLDDDEKGTHSLRTPGGDQQVTVVNEPGLYSLILRSRKPEAKTFKRWVTHEVLPAIRQTGRYEVVEQFSIPQTYAEALELAARQAREIETKAAELAVATPKAQAWDTLASADGDFSVRDAAKILSRDPQVKLGERRLFTLLGSWGWLYRQQVDHRWRVMQTAVETGRLSEIPASHYHPRSGDLVLDPPQVRVTAKGLLDVHRRLGGKGPLPIEEPLALGP